MFQRKKVKELEKKLDNCEIELLEYREEHQKLYSPKEILFQSSRISKELDMIAHNGSLFDLNKVKKEYTNPSLNKTKELFKRDFGGIKRGFSIILFRIINDGETINELRHDIFDKETKINHLEQELKVACQIGVNGELARENQRLKNEIKNKNEKLEKYEKSYAELVTKAIKTGIGEWNL